MTYPSDAFWLTFRRDIVEANGIRQHVVTGGSGKPLVLIHGLLETWSVWRAVMPALAERYQVIVPDLRGFGDTERPAHGYDKKTLGEDVAALLYKLGIDRALVAGHDFGGQVAYRLAAARPALVTKLAVIEALLPGIAFEPRGNEQTRFWIYGFHQVPEIPELLTRGHERPYIAALYRQYLHPQNVMTPEDHEEVLRAFGQPGALQVGFELYRTGGQDETDFRETYKTKLQMPVLALGGAHCFERRVIESFAQVANDVTGGVVEQAAHFVPMEQPEETVRQLTGFFDRQPAAKAA